MKEIKENGVRCCFVVGGFGFSFSLLRLAEARRAAPQGRWRTRLSDLQSSLWRSARSSTPRPTWAATPRSVSSPTATAALFRLLL